MDWRSGMDRAIDSIEENLAGDIDLAAAARHAGCSLWEFQRVFSFMTHVPLGEYIRRRRLTLAAEDLKRGGERIIDIALKYGYDSPAAFTRAFSQLHGVSPTRARGGGGIPKAFPRITFEINGNGWSDKMEKFAQRGYVVRENGPVYFTMDMDKTLKWFQDVLGWYGDIVARDDSGRGMYGCVFDYPDEVAVAHITPFRGFHLFRGAPAKGVAGFLMVEGLDALRRHVLASGWEQITDIEPQHWGARECGVTTPEGCTLRFFETLQE